MPTPHNEAKKDEIAKTVIMPGDPMRAKYIAEKYLEDYKLVNKVRGMFAYTGYYKGKKITVMAHGMGIPSAAIYTYELFNYYGVDNIIRIGTCGSYSKDLPLRSVLLVDEVYSNTNYDVSYGGPNKEILKSNKYLNDMVEKEAANLKINLVKGRTYCSEPFYTKDEVYDKMCNEYGCMAVEMEGYAVLYNADLFKKKATCILTVSDNLVTKQELPSEQRERAFDEMIELALNVAIKL